MFKCEPTVDYIIGENESLSKILDYLNTQNFEVVQGVLITDSLDLNSKKNYGTIKPRNVMGCQRIEVIHGSRLETSLDNYKTSKK